MSGGFFDYQADAETASECQGLIERAFERLQRGQPITLGERKSTAMGHTSQVRQSNRNRLELSSAKLERIFSMWRQGRSRVEIAAAVGCSVAQVQILTAAVPREARLRRSA